MLLHLSTIENLLHDEVLGIINSQFARLHYSVYDIGAGGGNDFKIFIGLAEQEHTYVSGGTVTFNGNTVNVTDFVYDNTVTGNATVTIASSSRIGRRFYN